MTVVPPVHNWLAGDPMNAIRMNEITDVVNWVRNPPMVHVGRASSTQNIADNSWTKISFDTVHSTDPYDFFDGGTPDQLTCTVPGWYSIEAGITMNATAANCRLIMGIYKNGMGSDQLLLRADQQNAPSSGNNNLRKEFKVFLNVDDWVHLAIHHNETGVTRTSAIFGTWEHSQMRIRWVSN